MFFYTLIEFYLSVVTCVRSVETIILANNSVGTQVILKIIFGFLICYDRNYFNVPK